MKERTCCFTGHRNIYNIYETLNNLENEIEKLILKDICYFGIGGALGFDTLAALTVIKLKFKYTNIRLILVLPCKNQGKYWNKKDRILYSYIKLCADKIVYISKEYNDKCMYKRNRYLINNSSYCICYLSKNKGGTFYTISYAKNKNIKIINIAK